MKPDNPFISIIIPIYNVEKYIRCCILSVVAQTFQDFEVILVDDGSIDRSTEIAEDLLTKAGIPTKMVHQENMGLAEARNSGVRVASGQWMMFLDSDDTIAIDTLERMSSIVLNEDVDIIIPDYQTVTPGEERKLPGYDNGVEFLGRDALQVRFLKREIKILAPATLYKKSWYDRHQMRFTNIAYGEDQHFLWLMLLAVKRACYLKWPCYNYLRRPNSIMTSSKYEKIIDAHPFYKALEDTYRQSDAPHVVKEFLYPRYIFGILHSAIPLCSSAEYYKLGQNLHARKYMSKLLRFPQYKVRILSLIYLFSPRSFVRLLSSIGKNDSNPFPKGFLIKIHS